MATNLDGNARQAETLFCVARAPKKHAVYDDDDDASN